MNIIRILEDKIKSKVDYRKAIIILGPRQVGKTTLIKKIAQEVHENFIYVNGDDPEMRSLWRDASQNRIRMLVGGVKMILFDEAQKIENIGNTLKMIVDSESKIQVIVSGSSSLDIANQLNEPLTGRKWEYNLFPISWGEYVQTTSVIDGIQNLESMLIYGMYPDVLTHPSDQKELLSNLAGSYLFKDILELSSIRRPELLVKILRALSWQVGSEVSFNELAATVEADKATVKAYVDLLERSFVVFQLSPFSRNQRNEINKSRKIYFYDNGIRNALIGNYSPLSGRNDIGQLWENFVISEMVKKHAYTSFYGNIYFWRTTQQAEIDLVIEEDGKLIPVEIMWNPKARVRFPRAFMNAYHPEKKMVINKDNFFEYLGMDEDSGERP